MLGHNISTCSWTTTVVIQDEALENTKNPPDQDNQPHHTRENGTSIASKTNYATINNSLRLTNV